MEDYAWKESNTTSDAVQPTSAGPMPKRGHACPRLTRTQQGPPRWLPLFIPWGVSPVSAISASARTPARRGPCPCRRRNSRPSRGCGCEDYIRGNRGISELWDPFPESTTYDQVIGKSAQIPQIFRGIWAEITCRQTGFRPIQSTTIFIVQVFSIPFSKVLLYSS